MTAAISGTWSHLSARGPDSQHERARHLAIVGQFELGRGRLPHRDFPEEKSVFVLNVNTFGAAERLQGELPAVPAHIMFFKNRACVRHDTWERHIYVNIHVCVCKWMFRILVDSYWPLLGLQTSANNLYGIPSGWSVGSRSMTSINRPWFQTPSCSAAQCTVTTC